MVEAAGHEPVGRAVEVAALERFAAELGDGSAAVLVRGEPGIGKTTLWRGARAAAEASGVLVLAARCVEAEMPIAMCGLADLLEPVAWDVLDELPIPQREALAGALGLEPSARSTADRIVLPKAVTAALRALTQRGPVLVAVDDVQWLDPASARLLAFAVRRLVDRPLGALITLRGDATEPDPLALATSFGPGRFEEIRLGPLSTGALGHLLRSTLDVHVPRPTLKRIHEVSRGNPMYALELMRGLTEPGETRPLADVPLPASLDELMRARVDQLPAETRPLLETVTALERPTSMFLERAIEGAWTLLDLAVTAEAVVVDAGVIRFAHPLLASAVYTRIPPSRRRDLHARLAALIEDPEGRARHLALAAEGPDHEVAEALDEAARRAARRGAFDAAAILVEHACRLTPPTEPAALVERMLTEAEYLAGVDEHGRAREIVSELLATPVAGPPRVRALMLGVFLSPPPDVRGGLALLEEALAHTGEDRRLHARVLSWIAYSLGFAGEYVTAEKRTREAVELATRAGDESLASLDIDLLFDITSVRGTQRPASFEDLLAVDPARQVTVGQQPRLLILGRERRRAGDLATARAVLERALAACDELGAEHMHAAVLDELAEVELRSGNWNLAGSYLDEALGVQIDGADFFGQATTRSAHALLAAYRGEVDDARRLAQDAIAFGREWGEKELVPRNRWILGFVELSLGEPREAWTHLQGLPEALRRMGIGEPGHLPALPDVIETLATLGRLEEADGVLAELEAQARKLEHRWATPAALRCRALLALARGESDTAVKLADQAAAGFEAAGFPFDRGRSLLAAGDALRRLGQRRRAAEKLKEADQIFERLGAALWHDRAQRELRRAAPRPRRDEELTAAERRVAALVAAGRTNREVAAELFTTVSTVEAHLTRVYRKLDVRSRTDLARRASDIS